MKCKSISSDKKADQCLPVDEDKRLGSLQRGSRNLGHDENVLCLNCGDGFIGSYNYHNQLDSTI